MVKVIWHKTASPSQMDGSVIFARWRRCALPCWHIGATWPIRLNCPMSICGSDAVLCQITLTTCYYYMYLCVCSNGCWQWHVTPPTQSGRARWSGQVGSRTCSLKSSDCRWKVLSCSRSWLRWVMPANSVCHHSVLLGLPPHHHHIHFTALFLGPPGWAGARRGLLDFMAQWKRGRHTDHPAGRHYIQTNQCPPPPSPIFFTSWMIGLPTSGVPTSWNSAFGLWGPQKSWSCVWVMKKCQILSCKAQ